MAFRRSDAIKEMSRRYDVTLDMQNDVTTINGDDWTSRIMNRKSVKRIGITKKKSAGDMVCSCRKELQCFWLWMNRAGQWSGWLGPSHCRRHGCSKIYNPAMK